MMIEEGVSTLYYGEQWSWEPGAALEQMWTDHHIEIRQAERTWSLCKRHIHPGLHRIWADDYSTELMLNINVQWLLFVLLRLIVKEDLVSAPELMFKGVGQGPVCCADCPK